jgi:hypothetical protein
MCLKVSSLKGCSEIACHILAVICLHDYLHPRQRSKVVLDVFCVISEPWVRDHVSTLLESISVCVQSQALESE